MYRALILILVVLFAQAQVPAPVGGDASNMTVKPTGRTNSRALDNRALDIGFNLMDYTGAKADGVGLADSGVTISGNIVTFTNANFTADRVGQQIFIQGAGASGNNYIGAITGFTSTHVITVNPTPSTPMGNVSAEVAYGTDNILPFNAMFAAARAIAGNTGDRTTGASIYCPPGNYYVSSSINATALGLQFGSKNVTIYGPGCNIIGTAVSGPVLDMLGDTNVIVRDISIYGGFKGGNASMGIQIGRYGKSTTNNPGAQAVYNEHNNVHVWGWFSRSALYNFAAEDYKCDNSTFYNANSGSGSYAAIYDGLNHWNAISNFVTQDPANAVDQPVSFDDDIAISCHFQNVGTSGSLWVANARHIEFQGGFLQNQGAGGSGVVLYGTPQENLIFNIHMENQTGLSQNFLISGAVTPIITELFYRDGANQALNQIIALDTGVTSATISNLTMKLGSVTQNPKAFDNALNYTIRHADIGSSDPGGSFWLANPASFTGTLCLGGTSVCAQVLAVNASPPSGMRGTIYYDNLDNCPKIVVTGATRTCIGYTQSTHLTANTSLTAVQSGIHFDNATAAGEVDATLPLAANGISYCFSLRAGQIFKIIANAADKIGFGSTVSASGGNISASQLYASVCMEAQNPGAWTVTSTADKTQWTVQ